MKRLMAPMMFLILGNMISAAYPDVPVADFNPPQDCGWLSNPWDDPQIAPPGLKWMSEKSQIRNEFSPEWIDYAQTQKSYDTEGKLTESRHENFYGGQSYRENYSYKYDEKRRVIEKTVKEFFSEKTASWTYEYDEDGKISNEGYYHDSELILRRATIYHDGIMTERNYYKYGDQKSEELYNPDGQLRDGKNWEMGNCETINCYYDDRKRLISAFHEISSSNATLITTLKTKSDYKYDDTKRMSTRILTVIKIKDDNLADCGELGREQCVTATIERNPITVKENRYNENYKIVELLQYELDDKGQKSQQLERRTYSYDAKGNLTKENWYTYLENGAEFQYLQTDYAYEYYEPEKK